MPYLAIGAILAMTMAASSADASESPLRLVSGPAPEGVQLRIVGLSPVACGAHYELEVVGQAGSNRSVQRGAAQLLPGKEVVLATTTLGGKGAGGWSATLRVDSCDGRHFEEMQGPAAPDLPRTPG